jgi:hypothetical protein
MIRQDLIEKIANIQNEEIEKAATKALEQMEKERKGDNPNAFEVWFRWVELTGKYLKNKLN